MPHLTEFILLSVLVTIFIVLVRFPSSWRPVALFKPSNSLSFITSLDSFSQLISTTPNNERIKDINNLAGCHETAATLASLIHKDGAGSWPPRSNHVLSTWPPALRPYQEIYDEMAPLLPAADVSTNDKFNRERITNYRARFRKLLDDKINLEEVNHLLDATDVGRWDVFPRDTYNGFYACIAWCRHAYRWATIPVVSLAQLETTLTLPTQLVTPWTTMQSHFSLTSDSGNNMSNLVLNFTPSGEYVFKINSGLLSHITSSEEEFACIFYEVEVLAVPIYHAIVQSIIAFARNDKAKCLSHVKEITVQLRPLFSAYYDRVHDGKIARNVWLSRVQGFYAWGLTGEEKDWESQTLVRFDGLSGNQVLLFQALDAFLGLEPYLTRETMYRNVPGLQREFCDALGRHCFRGKLRGDDEGVEGEILKEMGEIVKRLRLFRSAHRTRAKVYLSQPAPERLPMTAGKSLLKSDLSTSLEYLDEFMVGRLNQTV